MQGTDSMKINILYKLRRVSTTDNFKSLFLLFACKNDIISTAIVDILGWLQILVFTFLFMKIVI